MSLSAPHLYSARMVLVDSRQIIPEGAVLVREGIIEAVGPRCEFPRKPECAETDLGNAAIVPGLVNAHAHLRLMQCWGRFRPGPFHEWLPQMIGAAPLLSAEDIASGIREGLEELAQWGTTTVGDIGSDGLALPLLEASGLRHVFFHEVIHMGPPPYEPLIARLEQQLGALRPGLLGMIGISPHAPYTVAAPLMAALRRHFQGGERAMPFAVHVAESRAEMQCLATRQGPLANLFRRMGFYPAPPERAPLARSVGRFLSAGLPGAPQSRDLLIHGNYLTRAAMARLARGGRSALVVCPGTRLFHGVQTPVFAKAADAGLPVALGTDSLASNTGLNMWEEMRRALRMAPRWTAADAFDAATVEGAQALGMDGRVGRMAAGYGADFIACPLDDAFQQIRSARDMIGLLLQKQTPRIGGVWVAGKPVRAR